MGRGRASRPGLPAKSCFSCSGTVLAASLLRSTPQQAWLVCSCRGQARQQVGDLRRMSETLTPGVQSLFPETKPRAPSPTWSPRPSRLPRQWQAVAPAYASSTPAWDAHTRRGRAPGLMSSSCTLSAGKKNLQNMNYEWKTQAEQSWAINNSELQTH